MKTKLLLLSLLALSGFVTIPAMADTPAAREITITANDSMQFSVKEITAAPGEKLRFTLNNIGKIPKTAMGHNWVLLKPMTPDAFNTLAMSCAGNAPEFLPKNKAAVLAHTKILGGGESDTIEFTAPATPGKYPFFCSFPGHFGMMKGNLIVQ
jgi:azurin